MDHDALLKTLLHEVKDGVIVCDADAKITLFNKAAEDLFGLTQTPEKERSLYNLCLQAPVEQALSLLRYQHELKKQPEPFPSVQFINTSISQEQFFRCRVCLTLPLAAANNFFVIIFEDISSWYVPDNPLYMKIEDFRGPMSNLQAAVENLTEYPEMSPVMRSAFENVLVQETLKLTEAFNALAGSCRLIMQTQHNLTKLNTEVLFGYVAQHLQDKKISVAASAKQSIWVKIDIYGLLLVLDYLVTSVRHSKQKKTGFSCELHCGPEFVYFDFIWSGPVMPSAAVEKMLQKKLKHSIGRMTASSILHTMEGDIWSQQHENSKSMLRLALPISRKGEQQNLRG
jgi:DNA polymerase-3 subunit epsilon